MPSTGMSDGDSALVDGLAKLVGSQIFTRLATFGLNQAVTRALSVEAYGLLSIRFHLINTSILLLSREGLRRGCLRLDQDRSDGRRLGSVLVLSSLCLPLGLLTTLVTCWFFGPRDGDETPGYRTAIALQGNFSCRYMLDSIYDTRSGSSRKIRAAALLELASEPLYILAQGRLLIGLRVRIEAAATVAKIAATLGLIWSKAYSEAIAISLAQIIFAAVLLLGYGWHFVPEALAWANSNRADQKTSIEDGADNAVRLQDVMLCGSFTAQAFEKLLLAEGTKIAMTRVQDAYDQGVYGLVVNLGSVVVRTLFQPVEEAAFLTFSRPLPAGRSPFDRLSTLLPLLRAAILAGLIASAFGPSNTFLLLHLLYGPKYSLTEAPAALALYSPYILLLAANGILECFVHAVATGPELWQGHVALLLITAAQTVVTLLLVASHGTLGMIAADGTGMLLRIAYCIAFIRGRLRRTGGKGQHQSLWGALPSRSTFAVLIASGLGSAVSAAFFLEKGPLAGFVPEAGYGIAKGALCHLSTAVGVFAVTLSTLYRTERPLWSALRQLKHKHD